MLSYKHVDHWLTSDLEMFMDANINQVSSIPLLEAFIFPGKLQKEQRLGRVYLNRILSSIHK